MLILIAKELLICLTITIVIEYIPIVIFLKIPKNYFVAVNVLTNVVANVMVLSYDILATKMFLPFTRLQLIMALEIIICIVEIFLYYIYIKRKNITNDNANMTINVAKNKFDSEKMQMTMKIVVVTAFANIVSFVIGNKLLVTMSG